MCIRDRHRAQGPGGSAVAGQQAFAAAAALRAQGQVGRPRATEQVEVGELLAGSCQGWQPWQLAGQVQTLELVHFHFGQRLVRGPGQQPGQLVATGFLRQGQGAEFLLQVDRLAERVQAEDQRRVFRLPVFGAIATTGQACWQLVAVAEQVGVDPCLLYTSDAADE